jgi:uncharacterized protein (TIGR00304 family)
MRKWLLASILLFISGVALIIASVSNGEGQVGLFLIFPFIVTQGWMGAAGSLLLFLAIISFFIGSWTSATQDPGQVPVETNSPTPAARTKKSFGGVVLIGPIPIVFGSDEKIAKSMLMIAVAILAAFVLIVLILSLSKMSP